MRANVLQEREAVVLLRSLRNATHASRLRHDRSHRRAGITVHPNLSHQRAPVALRWWEL
jgi:hypothetical protein